MFRASRSLCVPLMGQEAARGNPAASVLQRDERRALLDRLALGDKHLRHLAGRRRDNRSLAHATALDRVNGAPVKRQKI